MWEGKLSILDKNVIKLWNVIIHWGMYRGLLLPKILIIFHYSYSKKLSWAIILLKVCIISLSDVGYRHETLYGANRLHRILLHKTYNENRWEEIYTLLQEINEAQNKCFNLTLKIGNKLRTRCYEYYVTSEFWNDLCFFECVLGVFFF